MRPCRLERNGLQLSDGRLGMRVAIAYAFAKFLLLLRQGSLTPHLLRWGGIVVHSHPIDTANRHVHNRGCTSLPGVWEEGP